MRTLTLPKNYSRLSIENKFQLIGNELATVGLNISGLSPTLVNIIYSFNAATVLQVVGLAQIVAENQPTTVRGAMYRGIQRLWEDSSDPCYNKCARLILQMRRKHILPYSWIVDGTRTSIQPSSWTGLEDYAEACAYSYRKDLWARQPDYIEVFVEKDAMSGVIAPVTREYDVKLNPIRGFGSETHIYNIAEEWSQIEKPIYIYYLGDHDYSGLAIEQDLRKRLIEFSERTDIHWQRLAITPDDFANEELLGFKVKRNPKTKAKWQPYLDKSGDRCVEVDAIPANEIRERVRQTIEGHINQEEWQFLKEQEAREKLSVLDMVRGFTE